MTGAAALDILLMAGAIAWLTTALVKKDGPNGILRKLRYLLDRLFGGQSKNPLNCFTCTTFWVTILVAIVWQSHDTNAIAMIQLFGVMGIAAAVRGLSQEF